MGALVPTFRPNDGAFRLLELSLFEFDRHHSGALAARTLESATIVIRLVRRLDPGQPHHGVATLACRPFDGLAAQRVGFE
jgi:hypothetical protein